jgi:hypothetical protein
MNGPLWILCLLGAAATLAMVRLAWRLRADFGVRDLPLLVLQPLLAALLYLTLFPPEEKHGADELVLATANTSTAQLTALNSNAIVLALPEAPSLPGVTRVPDLGSALRQHPQASRLRVLGAGLVARDRDLARGHALAFDASPLPRGLVALWSPVQVGVGALWPVSGRVNALSGGTVELLDPSGQNIATMRPGADGRFLLHGTAPAVGGMRFALRLRDAQGRVVENIDLPLQVTAGSALRVLVLAGGPDPELKYLRRWAVDAGVQLHTQISVGAGLQIGDAPMPIDAASLRGFDLVVLDERAWRELGAIRKSALHDALRAGLGLLLRINGPLAPGERRQLQAWGFGVDAVDNAVPVLLSASDMDPAPTPSANAVATGDSEPLLLSRQPLRVSAGDGLVMLRDAQGNPLSLWRDEGRGRIALWWLGDSDRLVLAGQSAAHGRLWSRAFATLARGHGSPLPRLDSTDPRVNQRLVACGLGKRASIETDRSAPVTLLSTFSSTGERCAAYWPATSGWHRLRNDDAELPFFVRGRDEAPGLLAQATRQATEQLLSSPSGSTGSAQATVPGPRWPWFLAWLLAAGLGWWLERRSLRSRFARTLPL